MAKKKVKSKKVKDTKKYGIFFEGCGTTIRSTTFPNTYASLKTAKDVVKKDGSGDYIVRAL